MVIELMGARGLSRQRAAREFVARYLRDGQRLTTTRINEAELLVGAERAADRDQEVWRASIVLDSTPILEFDERASARFGRIKSRLLNLGKPVGDMDLLIAAICLVNGQSLITRNIKDFVDVPGLVVESY